MYLSMNLDSFPFFKVFLAKVLQFRKCQSGGILCRSKDGNECVNVQMGGDTLGEKSRRTRLDLTEVSFGGLGVPTRV